jgi:thioesterase domain-containing protein
MRRKYQKLLALFRTSPENEQRQHQIKRIEQAMFRAAARYTMRPYSGRILTFVASQRVAEHDSRYGWGKLAEGGHQTIEVATRRTADLLASPHAEEVVPHILRFIADNSHDIPVPSKGSGIA